MTGRLLACLCYSLVTYSIKNIVSMLLVSKPPRTPTSTNNNRCLPAFSTENLTEKSFIKKLLETFRDASQTYNTLLSRPRQLALTYYSFPISTHISERKCSTVLYS
jgi:hypothetical protein